MRNIHGISAQYPGQLNFFFYIFNRLRDLEENMCAQLFLEGNCADDFFQNILYVYTAT